MNVCLDDTRAGQGEAKPKPLATTRLTERASLNAAALFLDYGAKIAVGLVVTSALVSGLGRSLFGVWEMMGRLVGYMAAADGRPAEALRLVIANRQACEDDALKRRYVGSAISVWLLFLPVLATAGLALAWYAPAITRAPAAAHSSVRFTCGLLVLNFLLLNLVALPEAVLRGMNLGYKRMGLQAGLNVAGGALTIAAIRLGGGMTGAASAQLALSVVTGLLFYLVVRRYVAWFGANRPFRAEMRPFLRVSLWNFAGSMVSRVQLSSDVVILGIAASTSAVSTYVLTGYAAQASAGIATLALIAIIPGLGGVIGDGQLEKAAALRGELLTLSWLFATTIGATILMWNRSFLHLWVGGRYYAGPVADLLIVLLMVQTVFIRSDSYVIDATLQLRSRVIASVAAAALSITFSIALTRTQGIPGLCVGLLAGRLAQTIAYPLIAGGCLCRQQARRTNYMLDLRGMIRPALLTTMLFAAGSWIGQKLIVRNWPEWVIGAGLSVLVVGLLASAAGLTAESRGRLLRRARALRFPLRA